VNLSWEQHFVLVPPISVRLGFGETSESGDGANRPDSGFFGLEKDLGRYKAEDDATWLAELDGLFTYGGEH
jgi:hypothetical protein